MIALINPNKKQHYCVLITIIPDNLTFGSIFFAAKKTAFNFTKILTNNDFCYKITSSETQNKNFLRRSAINSQRFFLLKGLDCANCASKIERQCRKIPGVIKSSVDFLEKTLVLEMGESGKHDNETEAVEDAIFAEIKRIVSMIEPDVEVVETRPEGQGDDDGDHEHDHEEYSKAAAVRLVAGGAFLAAGIFGKEPFGSFEAHVTIAVYLFVAWPLIVKAVKNLFNRNVFDENFLMVFATCGALFIREYHEAIGVMVFFQIGEMLQDYSVASSRKSIRSLMNIRPDYVNLKRNGEIVKVAPGEAAEGDLFVVKPGERVPLDGTVTEGATTLDTSSLTGESVPRDAAPGDEVLSGSINISGMITLRALRAFGESTVSKILRLISESSRHKAKTEQFITKFARVYTPAVVGLAVLICLAPYFYYGRDFSVWFKRSLIFLVISCPCALVISIPLGFFGGIGSASRRGILIKGANHLEALNQVSTVIFDKTGTITSGRQSVVRVAAHPDASEAEMIRLSAIAGANSSHPASRAIAELYDSDSGAAGVTHHEEVHGVGVFARIDGKHVFVGSDKYLHQENIPHDVCNGDSTTVHSVIDRQYSGYFLISDTIREDATDLVGWLRGAGIRTIMLTGDNPKSAENIATTAGIDSFEAGLLPHQKVEMLEYYRQQTPGGRLTAFIGDGMNDAPVIARADIGIAMGGVGSDAAIEAADIVFMDDRPSRLVDAIKIARKTRSVVLQNIVFALGVKGAFLVLGAAGMANLWEAVFADVGVALLAVMNSMRTLKV